MKLAGVLSALVAVSAVAAVDTTAGNPVYTASKSFPTHLYPSMYYNPKNQEQEPRPVITRQGGGQFPDNLANGWVIPSSTPEKESVMPPPLGGPNDVDGLIKEIFNTVGELFRLDNASKKLTCNKCRSALSAFQTLARAKPDIIPHIMESVCKSVNLFNAIGLGGLGYECKETLSAAVYGGPITDVLQFGNFTGPAPDAVGICAQVPKVQFCDWPSERLSEEFLNNWFHGSRHPPKHVVERWEKNRAHAYAHPNPKDYVRMLHISDLHLDPRYFVGGEARCTWRSTVQCCRINSFNTTKFHGSFAHGPLPDHEISQRANYWGADRCDTPWSLMANSFEAIKHIGGDKGYDLAMFTGDLVAHDDLYRYSRDYVLYAEQAQFDIMKSFLGDTPVLVTLGNHDTSPENTMTIPGLPNGQSHTYDWDLDYVAKLWQHKGWIDAKNAGRVREHYGSFSMSPRKGLRVISLNTDYWYYVNFYNYIHMDYPDNSGMLRFLTDELFAAEEAGERVWIMGHVLTGWNGGEALDRPSNLFYQIVSRFAPTTIAHIFFGHTHEDQLQVFYENDNGVSASAKQHTQHAVTNAYVAPSITPYINLNPTFRVYKFHPETFDTMDYDQYYTPISEFEKLKDADHGPVWRHLYSAREAYGNFHQSVTDGNYAAGVKLDGTKWPWNAPLNGTFWSAMTDEMEARPSLVTKFSEYQSRMNPTAKTCTKRDCIKANICFMRSSTPTQGRKCGEDYSSVSMSATEEAGF